jgi:gas vesicle protein
MLMSKNKKMATFGLILALVGAITAAIGGFIYNKYSGKSRKEDHLEVIASQKNIETKVDSTKELINSKIDETKAEIQKAQKNQSKESKKILKEVESKNQIVNNAPNQGVQINEVKGNVFWMASLCCLVEKYKLM